MSAASSVSGQKPVDSKLVNVNELAPEVLAPILKYSLIEWPECQKIQAVCQAFKSVMQYLLSAELGRLEDDSAQRSQRLIKFMEEYGSMFDKTAPVVKEIGNNMFTLNCLQKIIARAGRRDLSSLEKFKFILRKFGITALKGPLFVSAENFIYLNHSLITVWSSISDEINVTKSPQNIQVMRCIFNDPGVKIEQIKELYLNNSSLRFLPPEINKLTGLTVLSALNNKLTAVNVSCFTNLTELRLSQNELRIPPNVRQLTKLVTLDLEKNQLTLLPDTKHLTSLVNFYFQNNSLATTPDLPESQTFVLNVGD